MPTNGIIGKMQAAGGLHLLTSTLYGTCDTAAATAAKTVRLADTGTNTMTLITGMTLSVKFTYSNTAANPTLEIRTSNGTTILQAAKSIKVYGTTAPGATTALSWQAGAVLIFIYDGTNWVGLNPTWAGKSIESQYIDTVIDRANALWLTGVASGAETALKVNSGISMTNGTLTANTFIGNLTGNADTADAANITSTKYGVSYYTNNTGTFASTTAGTAGQVFISGGANAAPDWKSFTTAVVNTGYTLVNPASLSASWANEVLTLTPSTVQLTSSGTTNVLTGVTGVVASYINGNGASY